MGIATKALWRSWSRVGWRPRIDGGLFARGVGVDSSAPRLRQSPGLERATIPVGETDRQRGTDAGIAVRGVEAEHDYGRRQRDGHDESQENG
jgi:hypothetical protein